MQIAARLLPLVSEPPRPQHTHTPATGVPQIGIISVVPKVGLPLGFVYSCWLSSLYCFEYTWINTGEWAQRGGVPWYASGRRHALRCGCFTVVWHLRLLFSPPSPDPRHQLHQTSGWSFNRRLDAFERHWAYFLGFGLPFTTVTYFLNFLYG